MEKDIEIQTCIPYRLYKGFENKFNEICVELMPLFAQGSASKFVRQRRYCLDSRQSHSLRPP